MTSLEKLCQIILKFKGSKLAPEMLKPSAHLTDDLKLDSLDRSELLVLAEIEFDLEIPLEDMRDLNTLGEAAAYFDKRLSA